MSVCPFRPVTSKEGSFCSVLSSTFRHDSCFSCNRNSAMIWAILRLVLLNLKKRKEKVEVDKKLA